MKHPNNEFDFEIVVSDDSSDSLYEALLKDSIEQLILSGFEVSDARIAFGRCPLCGQKIDIKDFVDELSRREYNISGMCQSCQDDVFGKDDESMVLSKPEAGWVDIHIGDKMLRASYTTDVAMDLLVSLTTGITFNQPVAVSFDSEECWWTLVLAEDGSGYIIWDAPYTVSDYKFNSVHRIEIDREEFARKIADEIEFHFDAWVDWDAELVDSKRARKKRIKGLRSGIKAMRNALNLRGVLEVLKKF